MSISAARSIDEFGGSGNLEALLEEIERLVGDYFAMGAQASSERYEYALAAPPFAAEEVLAVLRAMLHGRLTMGAAVGMFERDFADAFGLPEAVMLNSGSSANLLAVALLMAEQVEGHLERGDEVIVPALTWPTTVAPLVQLGLVPVFVDVDPTTLAITPEGVQAAMSPRVRAVVPVHMLGNAADVVALRALADDAGAWMLEDACQALGTEVAGRSVGSFGDLASFSFYLSHHISTIEGGMLVVNRPELVDVARSMRAHGWIRDMDHREAVVREHPDIDPRFLFATLGFNLRPTDLQGLLGSVQLRKLQVFNRERQERAVRVAAELPLVTDDLTFLGDPMSAGGSWFGIPLLARTAELRRGLVDHLEAHGIETRPVAGGNLTLQPAFRNVPQRRADDLAVATDIARRALVVGNHSRLTPADVDRLLHAIATFTSR
ncbi:MAG TPA: DegT/DnrJ/EryC1/StrS family aminotransferase [Gaiellaceae bacterium]